jgi:methionyl-tRNA formyltransferase
VRILFWGTPEFATPSLLALLGEGFDVVGVITQPDKPQGRSRSQLVPSPVKQVAIAEKIPVLQPARASNPEFLDAIGALQPDASVVVAYGHILTAAAIAVPPRGTFNVHASLLPALRGAAPIQAAIRQGLSETGISVMRVVPALDAGPVILRIATPIASEETYGELAARLSELGAQALIEALALVELGAARESPQDDTLATYAPKLARGAIAVDWTQAAGDVARSIRSVDPKPGSATAGPSGPVKLFGAQVLEAGDLAQELPPGDRQPGPGIVLGVGTAGMSVACGTGAVRIAQVQPAGRPLMSAADWARGRGIAAGQRLGA